MSKSLQNCLRFKKNYKKKKTSYKMTLKLAMIAK
jgi:hypothetical protein